jgi:ribosomal protein S18 acetylase RimI-like enzyme
LNSVRIEPFGEEHLASAADILGARHAHHRDELPLVAPGEARAFLDALWRNPGTSGAVAVRDGRMEAYVLAQVAERALFGRSAWIGHAGHAGDDDELLREVYAAASEAWVEDGAERHYVLVPAHARALAPWYRLGFAHMHVEALRAVKVERRAPPDGVILRLGTRADLEVAEEIDLEIYRLQARSPSFSRLPLDRDARRREWLEIDLREEGLCYLVAEERGRLVGHSIIYRPDPVLGVPADAAYLASTAVLESVRGRGIGAALVGEIIRRATEAGYGAVFTNWRMTNLSASRFWPAQGFVPIYHRLHRAVGLG